MEHNCEFRRIRIYGEAKMRQSELDVFCDRVDHSDWWDWKLIVPVRSKSQKWISRSKSVLVSYLERMPEVCFQQEVSGPPPRRQPILTTRNRPLQHRSANKSSQVRVSFIFVSFQAFSYGNIVGRLACFIKLSLIALKAHRYCIS